MSTQVQITKEHTPDIEGDVVFAVLRINIYNLNVGQLDRLINEAAKDFPGLQREKIVIKQYAGKSYARTFGIEFIIPGDAIIPEEYQEIPELEYTF